MKNLITTLIIVLLSSVSIFAQKMSWRDYSDLAEKSYKVQDYGTAAKNYKLAWQKKKSNLELLYKAGQSYTLVKNYKEAALAFEKVSKKSDKFPTASLEFAQTLKQDGSYEKSIEIFQDYIKKYKKEDKPQQQELVNREIEGAKKAMDMMRDSAGSAYKISYPGKVLNTNFSDFAPVPFGQDVLYFSSNRKGTSKIYKSEKKESAWTRPIVPDIFPKDAEKHIANGSFSYDYKRFYFNICKEVQGKNGPESKCDIYVMMKKEDKWSEPFKLRDYVNDSTATTTQPNVSKFGNKEILYFSSNRAGGYGGKDIWYCERDMSTDDIDFTVPKNCGPGINSFGDEITPWYDAFEGRLYYSSNGLVGAGGFDIFSNKGMGKDWKESKNMGFPVNSSADDSYFIKRDDRSSGYLVSNRTFGNNKNDTDDEDIFEFQFINYQNIFSGTIYDGKTTNPLKDGRIAIYETFPDGNEILVDNRYCPDGTFGFALDASKSFKAKIEKADYAPQFYRFATNANKGNKIVQDFNLDREKEATLAISDKSFEKIENDNLKKEAKSKPAQIVKPIIKPAPAKVVEKPVIVAKPSLQDAYIPRPASFIKEGKYYLIQLAAARYPEIETNKFDKVSLFGKLEHEPVPEKEMERVLLAWWADKKEAIKVLATVKRLGFRDAFITLHENGVRQAIVR